MDLESKKGMKQTVNAEKPKELMKYKSPSLEYNTLNSSLKHKRSSSQLLYGFEMKRAESDSHQAYSDMLA